MRHLLDTHAWIWWVTGSDKLSNDVLDTLARPDSELLLSAISVWELCKLVEKERLVISCDLDSWVEQALVMPGLRLVPLSPEISVHSARLPQPFHGDPADQIIVATAREMGAVLLTRDSRLQEYPHVKTLW